MLQKHWRKFCYLIWSFIITFVNSFRKNQQISFFLCACNYIYCQLNNLNLEYGSLLLDNVVNLYYVISKGLTIFFGIWLEVLWLLFWFLIKLLGSVKEIIWFWTEWPLIKLTGSILVCFGIKGVCFLKHYCRSEYFLMIKSA